MPRVFLAVPVILAFALVPASLHAQAFTRVIVETGRPGEFDFKVAKRIPGLGTFGDSSGLQSIRRAAGNDFVEFVFSTGAVRLDGVGNPRAAKHDCTIDGHLLQPTTFVGEVFRTKLPAAAGAGYQTTPDIRIFAPAYRTIVDGGTTTRNGAFSQVIKDLKYTIKPGGDATKTFTIVPKKSNNPNATSNLPRFDSDLTYPAQVRLRRDSKSPNEGIVMWDLPGFANAADGFSRGEFKFATGDVITLSALT